jgi:hypothetical protein
MDLNEMNENWQNEAPKLAAIGRTNPFSVPEGYFEEMERQLNSQIKICEFSQTNTFFSVPANYFEELPEKISSIVHIEELKNAEPVFGVPDDYFEKLESKINNKILAEVKQRKSKVRSIFSSWLTYASAACIASIIGIGVFIENRNQQDINEQIAQLPAEEIVDYLKLYSDAADAPEIIKSVEDGADLAEVSNDLSAAEIEQYLELNL